jgi:hypothetical protein
VKSIDKEFHAERELEGKTFTAVPFKLKVISKLGPNMFSGLLEWITLEETEKVVLRLNGSELVIETGASSKGLLGANQKIALRLENDKRALSGNLPSSASYIKLQK